jgi:uncharacterized protein (TIGR02118 family)
MIKRLSFARRRPGMSNQEFASHWLGPHAEIAREIPGLLGYVVNIIGEPNDVGWDGIAETWFDTREDAVRAFASEPVASRLAADRAMFLGEVKIVFVEEHVILAPPSQSPQESRPHS